MAAEGQEIKDERVENPTTTQEDGGDDEVGSTSLFTFFFLCHLEFPGSLYKRTVTDKYPPSRKKSPR